MAVEAFLLLAASFASGQEPAGRALMTASGCFACHRVGDSGGNAGPDLTYVGLRRSKDWLDRWLEAPHEWKPDTLMPDFRLKPKTRAAIVEYLAEQKGSGSPPWKGSKPAARGRLIYQRAGCVACHGPAGTGHMPNNNVHGAEIPALIHAKEGFTFEELEAMVRRGSKPIKEDASGPEPLVAMPAWGQVLSEDEIGDVARYVISFDTAPVAPEW